MIGSGAVSMAFVDTMLDETDMSFIIIDRHHLPGGHWNDAYPFVRLHQPSAFYGVASTELGSNRIDEAGPNKGLYELASGAEVSAYFDKVMRERFLPSGRVQYFPMCDYLGDGRFRSQLSPAEYSVSIRKKTVDGTFFKTSVPSTHVRKFEVADGVNCIPPNDLPRSAAGYEHFTILGGGKTAMDTGVWLLGAGANPDAITWVCPRDSWLVNRQTTQPGAAFFEQTIGGFAKQLEAMKAATSVDDLFARLESVDIMMRIDPSVQPSMFHYATSSRGEVEQLRRIRNVVRQGHVSHIDADALTMKNGETVPANNNTLYIDCTATAVQFVGTKSEPVFSGDRITIQALRAPLVTTSAALTAFCEANFDDEAEKNAICVPIGISDTPAEWIHAFLANMVNLNNWSQIPSVRDWFAQCRLNPARPMPNDAESNDPANAVIKESIGRDMGPAMANLKKLIDASSDAETCQR